MRAFDYERLLLEKALRYDDKGMKNKQGAKPEVSLEERPA